MRPLSRRCALQELEDEDNPNFLLEVCEMFFIDGEQKLNHLAQLLVGATPCPLAPRTLRCLIPGRRQQ